jgi:hypothetical protein
MMQRGVKYCTNTITTRYANMVPADKLTFWQNGFMCTLPPVEMVHNFSLVFTILFCDFGASTVELGFNVTEKA